MLSHWSCTIGNNGTRKTNKKIYEKLDLILISYSYFLSNHTFKRFVDNSLNLLPSMVSSSIKTSTIFSNIDLLLLIFETAFASASFDILIIWLSIIEDVLSAINDLFLRRLLPRNTSSLFWSKQTGPITAVSYTHLTLPTNREV